MYGKKKNHVNPKSLNCAVNFNNHTVAQLHIFFFLYTVNIQILV